MEKKPDLIIIDEYNSRPDLKELAIASQSLKTAPLLALSLAASGAIAHSEPNYPWIPSPKWSGKSNNNSQHCFTRADLHKKKQNHIRKIAKHSRQYNRRKQRGMRVSSRRI